MRKNMSGGTRSAPGDLMRIAVLADIHGNDVALQAVFSDIEDQGGVDCYWILGDLAAIGHAPVAVLELLHSRSNLQCLSGNTDRYVCTGDRPPPSQTDAQANPALLPILLSVQGSFSWTQGAITEAGHLNWLSNLPAELHYELPDGTTVLCTHGAPCGGDFSGIWPTMTKDEMSRLLAGCQSEVVCVGHTHWPLDVQVDGHRVINPGSVSNPVGPDTRASYALISADNSGYRFDFRRVEYDRNRVIEALQAIGHPARRFIISHLEGKQLPEELVGIA